MARAGPSNVAKKPSPSDFTSRPRKRASSARRRLPRFSSWAQRRLLYGEICSLGGQLDRLYSTVPSTQILVVVLDDVQANPRKEYLRVLDFLGVSDDSRSDFKIYNPSKSLRVPALRHLYRIVAMKRAAGINGGFGFWTWLQVNNMATRPRPPLSSEMLNILRSFFSKDVERLGLLLHRDLSSWLA
jgi:hypothetical protein